jgi:hypothetical protein
MAGNQTICKQKRLEAGNDRSLQVQTAPEFELLSLSNSCLYQRQW